MTFRSKAVSLITITRVVGLAIIIAGVVAAGFAAYYGLETTAHAATERALIEAAVSLRETKEHAKEQHDTIHQRIDSVQTQQTEALKRIEKTLTKNQDRLWELVKDKRERNHR